MNPLTFNLPCSITYTDDLPPGINGQARAWMITIRRGYENDWGLLYHEKTHVAQWWAGLIVTLIMIGIAQGIAAWALQAGHINWAEFAVAAVASLAIALANDHGLRYTHLPAYRLKCEAAAYAEQITWWDKTGKKTLTLDEAAERMTNPVYRLNITPAEAREAIINAKDEDPWW